MPTLHRPDAELHFEWLPAPGRPVVVLSHALGATAAMWDAQIEAWRGRFAMLRYDVRGHGRSSMHGGTTDIATLGGDVLALMEAAGIASGSASRPVHFCGLSMGGFVGLWLATQAGQPFSTFALCNTGARIGTASVWNERMAVVRDGGLAAVAEATLQRWFTPSFHASQPQTVATIRLMLTQNQSAGYLACAAMLRDTDLSALPARVRSPTLIISATHDASTPPALGHALAQNIAGARHREFDCAHLSNVECAPDFQQTLEAFWAEQTP